jgi:hypothetical protein
VIAIPTPTCAGKIGVVLRMKESSWKRSSDLPGPESWASGGNVGRQALTGVHAGRVSSRESDAPWHVAREFWSADALGVRGRLHSRATFARRREAPRGQRPRTRMDAPRTGAGRSRELTALEGAARIGKSKDTRR